MAKIAVRLGQSIVLSLSLFSLPLLALPLGAIAAPAKGGWVKVATNAPAKFDYYIDRGTLSKQAGFSYFWLYMNSSVGRPLGMQKKIPVYGVAFYLSADCQKANFRLRSMELLDQQGKQIDTDTQGDFGPLGQFNQQNPVGRSVLKYVCGR